jgi:hypothetical protein
VGFLSGQRDRPVESEREVSSKTCMGFRLVSSHSPSILPRLPNQRPLLPALGSLMNATPYILCPYRNVEFLIRLQSIPLLCKHCAVQARRHPRIVCLFTAHAMRPSVSAKGNGGRRSHQLLPLLRARRRTSVCVAHLPPLLAVLWLCGAWGESSLVS